MNTRLPDIFHCQNCGNTVHQRHSQAAPQCCGEVMFRAVANGWKDAPESAELSCFDKPAASSRTSVLLEAAAELSRWCHRQQSPDGSATIDNARYAELLGHVKSLRALLEDRFEHEEVERGNLFGLADESRFHDEVEQLHREHRELLTSVDRIVADLQAQQFGFPEWPDVCARVDAFASDFRRHEQSEVDLLQEALEKELGTAD